VRGCGTLTSFNTILKGEDLNTTNTIKKALGDKIPCGVVGEAGVSGLDLHLWVWNQSKRTSASEGES